MAFGEDGFCIECRPLSALKEENGQECGEGRRPPHIGLGNLPLRERTMGKFWNKDTVTMWKNIDGLHYHLIV